MIRTPHFLQWTFVYNSRFQLPLLCKKSSLSHAEPDYMRFAMVACPELQLFAAPI